MVAYRDVGKMNGQLQQGGGFGGAAGGNQQGGGLGGSPSQGQSMFGGDLGSMLGGLGGAVQGQQTPAGAPFNSQYYLQQNPDVAAAVQGGDFDSARQHYNQFGQAEGRQANPVAGGFQPFSLPQSFNPQFYMQQNPDVAQAVQSGDFASPLQHYRQYGQAEGRQPGSGLGLQQNFLSPGLQGMLGGLGGTPGFGAGDPSRSAQDYRQPFEGTVQGQQLQQQMAELQERLAAAEQMRRQGQGRFRVDRGGGNERGGAPDPGGGPSGPSGSGHTGPDGPAGSGQGRF